MSLTPEVSEEELFSADEEDEGEGFEDPYSAFEARAAAANMAAQSSHGSVDEGIGGSDSSQPRGTHAFDEEDCDFSPRKAPKKRRASTSSSSSSAENSSSSETSGVRDMLQASFARWDLLQSPFALLFLCSPKRALGRPKFV